MNVVEQRTFHRNW